MNSDRLAHTSVDPANDTSGALPTELIADLAAVSAATAGRLAAGATLWCTAPFAHWRARSFANEIGQGVDGSKTTLSAVAVPSDRIWQHLGPLAQAGDMLAVITETTPVPISAMREHASTWGLTTIWIGAGTRPEPGEADFVLWVEGNDASAAAQRLAMVCHELADLVHLDLARGHLSELTTSPACEEEICLTCSDEGRLGEVVALLGSASVLVRTPSGLETVDTSLIGNVRPGDVVLVHAGAAITIIGNSNP